MNRVPRCPPDAPRQLPEQGQIRTGFSSHSPESSLWARISTATSSCPMLISSVATSYAPITFRHCRSSCGNHAPGVPSRLLSGGRQPRTTCSVGTDRLVRSTPAPDAINIFRYMYARFLGEAASITGEPRFAGMGTELTAIGDRWEGVAATFAEAAKAENPADLRETATEPMHGIADREQDFWDRLDAMIAA